MSWKLAIQPLLNIYKSNMPLVTVFIRDSFSEGGTLIKCYC
jgi:hypothetical protein